MTRWTADQKATLAAEYRRTPTTELCAKLGLTQAQVHKAAYERGLSVPHVKREKRAGVGCAVDWARFLLVFKSELIRRRTTRAAIADMTGLHIRTLDRVCGGAGGLGLVPYLVICRWMGADPMAFLEDLADMPQEKKQ